MVANESPQLRLSFHHFDDATDAALAAAFLREEGYRACLVDDAWRELPSAPIRRRRITRPVVLSFVAGGVFALCAFAILHPPFADELGGFLAGVMEAMFRMLAQLQVGTIQILLGWPYPGFMLLSLVLAGPFSLWFTKRMRMRREAGQWSAVGVTLVVLLGILLCGGGFAPIFVFRDRTVALFLADGDDDDLAP